MVMNPWNRIRSHHAYLWTFFKIYRLNFKLMHISLEQETAPQEKIFMYQYIGQREIALYSTGYQ